MNEAEKQQQTEAIMKGFGDALQEAIDEICPGFGFALIVFEFNNPGGSNYISNADRASMIESLKETVQRLEQNQDIPAAHGTVQ